MLEETDIGIDINNIQPVVQRFMTAYANKPDDEPFEDFTANLIAIEMPEMPPTEIKQFCSEVARAAEAFDKNYESLTSFCRDGHNKNQWLYRKIQGRIASNTFQRTESSMLADIEEQSHALNICNCKLHELMHSNKTADGLVKSISREFKTQLKAAVAPELKIASKNVQEAAYSLGKNAVWSGIGGAIVSSAVYMVKQKANKQEIKTEEAVGAALTSGSDAGIKILTAAAIKVGLRKGFIPLLAKSTPAAVITNIACVGIENLKIMAKYSRNEISALEAMNSIAKTSVTMFYGLGWSAEGAVLGASFFSFLPVVGTIIGSVFGGMVGYIAGNTFGEGVFAGAKKLLGKARTFADLTWHCLCAKEKQEARLLNSLVQYQKAKY
jgi:hypothetical protein